MHKRKAFQLWRVGWAASRLIRLGFTSKQVCASTPKLLTKEQISDTEQDTSTLSIQNTAFFSYSICCFNFRPNNCLAYKCCVAYALLPCDSCPCWDWDDCGFRDRSIWFSWGAVCCLSHTLPSMSLDCGEPLPIISQIVVIIIIIDGQNRISTTMEERSESYCSPIMYRCYVSSFTLAFSCDNPATDFSRATPTAPSWLIMSPNARVGHYAIVMLPSVCLSVCHMPLEQKRRVIDMVTNNRRFHVGTQKHRSAWTYECPKRLWPWQICVVNISKTKTDDRV